MTTVLLPVSAGPSSLLAGPADRWRPARAGALRVWQYADEVVEFASGRLLLFGPNGSGKTMLLELTLPYLLDAKGQAGRLSTSGADRGGLWDRVTGYTSGEGRTGYLWVQFTRTVADGADQYLTIGTRLRAEPSGKGTHCWFTTSQRPGIDLDLLDAERRPLDVAGLTDAIGEHGRVWNKDTDGYRDAVRTTLFVGFSPTQMDALISTLLTVRKQSVTDGLSPKALNDLLTEGLPALDDREVTKVATGFEDLDSRRDQIAAMERDVAVVRRLHDAARRYARVVLGREAARVRSSESQRDAVTRSERLAREAEEGAATAKATLTQQDAELEQRQHTLDGRINGLKSSEAYANLGDLQARQQTAELSRTSADGAATSASRAAGELAEQQRRLEDEQAERDLAAEQLRDAAVELRGAATTAGIASVTDPTDDDALGEVVDAPLRAREVAVRQMRSALQTHTGAIERRDRASGQLEEATLRLTTANAAEDAARTAERTELRTWQTAITDWVGGLHELDPDTLSGVTELTEPTEVSARTARAFTEVAERLAGERQRVTGIREEVVAAADALRDEHAELSSGRLPTPTPPPWRQGRDRRRGAPLWQLVDFAPAIDARERDQLESSLRASGLLDAWVDADGVVTLPDDIADTTLIDGEPSVGSRTLADVLVAEDDAEVAGASVTEMLRGVAVVDRNAATGPERVAVAFDRSFRLGTLSGRGADTPAALIGATAQAQARARRLEEIDRLLHELDQRTAALDRELELLDARHQLAADDVGALPTYTALDAARRTLTEARGGVIEAADAQVTWETRLAAMETEVTAALRALSLLASQQQLPTTADGLEAVIDAIRRTRSAAETCRNRGQRLAGSLRRVTSLDADVARWTSSARELADEARRREHAAAEHEGSYAALLEAVGAEAGTVQRDLASAEDEQARTARHRTTLRTEIEQAIEVLATARSTRERAVEARESADTERETARARFAAAVGSTLFGDAGLDVPLPSTMNWTAVLGLARAVGDALPRVSTTEDSINRVRRGASEHFHAATQQLAGRIDLTYVSDDGHDWELLVAREDGTDLGCSALRTLVEARLDAARDELSASEQRVFEQTLTGAVRSHLADRIRTAQALVDGMNDVLVGVRTASGGVGIKLRWDVDGDIADRDTLKRVRELLLSGHHSPTEADELHRFLRDQIERVRAEDGGGGSWHERLTRILDYRLWHRFTILIHHDRYGDAPVAFGSRKVTLSAGEKTVALTLPLIAAVAAHYMPRGDGEAPDCPRLLLMDELFPKVDRPNKRQLLGLLPLLDLDAVFTSDKDWCNYDTLDQIAIHVVQKDDRDLSYTTRFVWNGSQQLNAPADATSSTSASTLAGLFDA